MDGVTYVYDNNGNLLNDGTNTYSYDSANRLKTFNGTSSYSYNGLGDRIRQTVNGQTTNYTLDLNAGLTQVLNDGTNAYVYGLGRIAQVNTTTEYFMGDALGSVRQLTNPSGSITYAKAYDPYGVVTAAAGTSQSAYGYTSEYTSQGLVYLRSRYYDPYAGRFISKDTWEGDINNPITFNRWQYANANPIMYTDPSGHIACKDVSPSWRPIFETLGWCDPDESPTLDLEDVIYGNGNTIRCGAGYVAFGYICVPISVEDEGQCLGIGVPLIQGLQSQENLLSQQCKNFLAEIRSALNGHKRVKQRYQEWVEDVFDCRKRLKKNPRDEEAKKCVRNHEKSYQDAQAQLGEAIDKWDRHKCGALPPDVADAREWIWKPLPP